VEPHLTNALIDAVEPKDTKSRTEIAEPSLAMERRLIDEPRVNVSNTESFSPALAAHNTLTLEPMRTKLRIDRPEAHSPKDSTEIALPNLELERSEMEEPRMDVSSNEHVKPMSERPNTLK
jgi:hypothetical protein